MHSPTIRYRHRTVKTFRRPWHGGISFAHRAFGIHRADNNQWAELIRTVISRFESSVSTLHSTKNSNGIYDKVYPVSSRLREHFMTSLALHVIPSSYNKFTPCLQYISGAGTGGGEADRNIPEHDSFPTLFQKIVKAKEFSISKLS